MEKGHNSLMRLGIIFIAAEASCSLILKRASFLNITKGEDSSCPEKFSLSGVTLEIFL